MTSYMNCLNTRSEFQSILKSIYKYRVKVKSISNQRRRTETASTWAKDGMERAWPDLMMNQESTTQSLFKI